MGISKTWIWVLIAIIFLALLWAAWQYDFFSRSALDNNTTAAIDEDLNAIDLGNPEQDLKNLDSYLNQL